MASASACGCDALTGPFRDAGRVGARARQDQYRGFHRALRHRGRRPSTNMPQRPATGGVSSGTAAFTVLGGSLPEAGPSGREDLVEQGLGLVLVRVLRERELAHQDLAGLGEHALLTGGESA